MKRTRLVVVALMVVGVAALGAWWYARTTAGLPRVGSDGYERAVRAFYAGVAALQVGLLEDGVRYFSEATTAAPGEPAAWGNLAVARLRLSDFDAAAPAVDEAVRLAGESAPVRVLAARMEIARGNLDAGIAHLRSAVGLDESNVRSQFALAEELERSGTPEHASEALAVLDRAAALAPANVVIALEHARLAAVQRDNARLDQAVTRLMAQRSAFPDVASSQLESLQLAAMNREHDRATRAAVLLRNALARESFFSADLAAVRTPPELIADTFDAFLRLEAPSSTPAAPDRALQFTSEQMDSMPAGAVAAAAMSETGAPVLFAADAASIRRVGGDAAPLAFPGGGASLPGRWSLLPLDWNNDFATDLLAAGAGGVRLYVQQNGTLVDVTAAASPQGAVACNCRGAWSADIDMDGDLDVVLGVRDAATIVLRNNGDGAWTPVPVFARARDVRGFGWADVDNDGDPDAALLTPDGVLVLLNNRAGTFGEPTAVSPGAVALTVADMDADGRFDLMTSADDGSIVRSTRDGEGRWQSERVVDATGASLSGDTVLLTADLDNNGALDLIRSGARAQVWLADESHALQPIEIDTTVQWSQVIDLEGDGSLDLLGTGNGVHRLRIRGEKGYHWKQIHVRAQQVAGDQRINPFAVGGEIDVRSGLLRQRQLLTGAPAHFGLGTRTAIDVARIVWPNGVPQVEFALESDDAIVAEQRLKGSCPWVFAHDGESVRFVTDFIWRSPLGLRLNALETAGVTQTEDWVRLRGDQLRPHNGRYDIRITAELWETHFFDHVSLLVVDHPADYDMLIDERFTPQSVNFAVETVRSPLPVTRATTATGEDVTRLVAERDGRHLATFSRGHYQGVAQEHAVVLDLPARAADAAPRTGERLVLVAQGWVYPTDSSINLALGQGTRERPRSVALEYEDGQGRWITAAADLGFPAGKNKTMLIDLTPARGAARIRLRTNMEIYWDALTTGVVTSAPVRTQRLAADRADLRYRGYSRTQSPRGDAPETPEYEPIEARGQRWRDLVGYYTRFGDVRELIAGVDDRYVIMNAGDELAMTFPVPPPPPDGWTRDFVLIGDGWEKDGDYNTEHSATVLPLPFHGPLAGSAPGFNGAAAPGPKGPGLQLEQDPVYRRHRDDWARYHTRYVRPDQFTRGLRTRPAAPPSLALRRDR